jgi:hypothetical protein
MKTRKTWLLISLLLIYFNATSQNIEEEIKTQLEAIARDNELEDDLEIESGFRYLQKHPLNINSATTDDWRVFPFINDLQLKSLEHYKSLFGKFISIYELQAVPLWNAGMLVKLKPFITVTEGFDELSRKSIFSGDHSLRLRETRVLEKQKGYEAGDNGYKGTPDHLLLTYRYRYRKLLDFGFTFEKDAGEPFFRKGIKGFDFFSFHVFVRGKGIARLVAVGDFTINLGQGLTCWQTLGFGKSSMATLVKRQGEVILPYTSSGEFNFHRGVALGLKKNKKEGYLFVSSQKLSVTTSPDSTEQSFSNFFPSGLHRTENEIAKRKKLHAFSAGGCIRYQTTGYRVGLNAITHIYSSVRLPGTEPYKLFEPSGSVFSNFSIDYSATPGGFHFFGEAAVDGRGTPAFINGLLITPSRNIDLAIVYRNISFRYKSLYGNAFTENSEPANESGLYMGMTVRPGESVQVEAYADYFRFPWLKYRVDRPSEGNDYLCILTWKPSKQWEIYTRFKKKTKAINTNDNLVIHGVFNTTRENWKTFFSSVLTPATVIKGCVEMVWYKEGVGEREEGFSGYIEAATKLSAKVSGNMRLAYFESASFNTRIYSYESNLPYSSQIPFFDGNGCRIYLNARVSIFKGLEVAARIARTVYNDKAVIGTGLEEIAGKNKTELGIQLQCSF